MRRLTLLVLVASVASGACGGDDENLLSREELLDPETCQTCHPRHYEEWSSSMHAYAADDPLFLAMNARGQRETGGDLGPFCVQCHAPMAVEDGLTTDGLNLDELPQKYKGVTCFFCHTTESVEGDHNNPLVLADDLVMRGNFGNPVDNGVHRAEYSPLHDGNHIASADLCGACHDIVTPGGVHLERTFAEWKESVFSRGFDLTCNECHMDETKNSVVADFEGVGSRSRYAHDFPGVDVAITDWPGKERQLAGIEEALQTTLSSKLCYNPAGNKMELTLTNIGAGHDWPSGSAQDRRAWVELRVSVGENEVVQSGIIAEGETVAEAATDDPLLWQMRDFTYKNGGEVAHMFWDVEEVDSALLPPQVTLDMTSPDFDHSVTRDYPLGANPAPDRVTAAVHIRPVGLDVIDDLIDSGDLDPQYRDEIPTFTLGGSVIEWTAEAAGADGCVP